MTLPPLSLSPLSLPSERRFATGALPHPLPAEASEQRQPRADDGATAAPATPLGADWLAAYLRLRGDDAPPREPTAEPLPLWAAALPRPAVPAAPPRPEPAGLAPATPTAQRLDAVRRLAEPAPVAVPAARVWQVELPGAVAATDPVTGSEPGWQLRIEQAQPLAPLSLTLQVPAQAQPLARQQLADLDRRLRLAGHDILRPGCEGGTPRAPATRRVDEVGP